jgi:hypothetical protein
MSQAFCERSSFRFRESFDRIHEVDMCLAALQQGDKVFAQFLILISCFAFLSGDPFAFFPHGGSLFV